MRRILENVIVLFVATGLGFLGIQVSDSREQASKQLPKEKKSVQVTFCENAIARLGKEEKVEPGELKQVESMYKEWLEIQVKDPSVKKVAWSKLLAKIEDIAKSRRIKSKVTFITYEKDNEVEKLVVKHRHSKKDTPYRAGITRLVVEMDLGFYFVWVENDAGLPVSSMNDVFPITNKEQTVQILVKR